MSKTERLSIPQVKRWLKEKSGKTSALANKVSEWANLSQNPSARVVDFGCGTGALAVEMAKRNTLAKIFGVDINDHRDHSLITPPNLDYYMIKPFSLAKESLNPELIILSQIIHHVPRKQVSAFIKDINNSLVVGGRVFIHEHEISESRIQILEKTLLTLAESISNRCLETMEVNYNFLTKHKLCELLEENNFKILKEESVQRKFVTIPQLAGNRIILAEKK